MLKKLSKYALVLSTEKNEEDFLTHDFILKTRIKSYGWHLKVNIRFFSIFPSEKEFIFTLILY